LGDVRAVLTFIISILCALENELGLLPLEKFGKDGLASCLSRAFVITFD
jgi:hypothetical protein